MTLPFYVQVATLGKSGVSVGYYDTEENAARAYDRAAIGLLGRDNCSITTNFPLGNYDEEIVPQLIGKTREEVKTTLKNERAKVRVLAALSLCEVCLWLASEQMSQAFLPRSFDPLSCITVNVHGLQPKGRHLQHCTATLLQLRPPPLHACSATATEF